jgi:hypothetical protein
VYPTPSKSYNGVGKRLDEFKVQKSTSSKMNAVLLGAWWSVSVDLIEGTNLAIFKLHLFNNFSSLRIMKTF